MLRIVLTVFAAPNVNFSIALIFSGSGSQPLLTDPIPSVEQFVPRKLCLAHLKLAFTSTNRYPSSVWFLSAPPVEFEWIEKIALLSDFPLTAFGMNQIGD